MVEIYGSNFDVLHDLYGRHGALNPLMTFMLDLHVGDGRAVVPRHGALNPFKDRENLH